MQVGTAAPAVHRMANESRANTPLGGRLGQAIPTFKGIPIWLFLCALASPLGGVPLRSEVAP